MVNGFLLLKEKIEMHQPLQQLSHFSQFCDKCNIFVDKRWANMRCLVGIWTRSCRMVGADGSNVPDSLSLVLERSWLCLAQRPKLWIFSNYHHKPEIDFMQYFFSSKPYKKTKSKFLVMFLTIIHRFWVDVAYSVHDST